MELEKNLEPSTPNQDSLPQTERTGHVADNPLLKKLNATWNQDKQGEISVMPFRMPKKAIPDLEKK